MLARPAGFARSERDASLCEGMVEWKRTKHRRTCAPGLMLILSSPSGAGKTTLTACCCKRQELDLTLSISADHARGPVERGRRHSLSFHRPRSVRAAARRRRIARIRRGPRQFLWHAARAGRGRSGRRAGDVLFDIDYQGTQSGRKNAARRRDHLHPAAVDERMRARLERARRTVRTTIDKRLDNARIRSAVGRITISCWSTTTSRTVSMTSRRSCAPSGCGARVAAGMADFVARLLAEPA